jgi:hypothetical protein
VNVLPARTQRGGVDCVQTHPRAREQGRHLYKKILTWARCTGTPSSYVAMADYSNCLRVINFEAREGVARFTAVGASTVYYGLQFLNMKMITIVLAQINNLSSQFNQIYSLLD